MFVLSPSVFSLVGILVVAGISTPAAFGADSEAGFRSIFDGRSLSGWSARDPVYWSVDEGTINSEPLLIGAETDGDRVVRHFHGDVEESAIWPRALTDAEVAALGR